MADGIARLYFNALVLTNGEFYSTAPQILQQLIVSSLNIDAAGTRNISFQILENAISYCAKYTTQDHSRAIFDTLLKLYNSSEVPLGAAAFLSKLLLVWTEEKHGKLIQKPGSFLDALIEHIKDTDWQPYPEFMKLLMSAIIRYCEDDKLHYTISVALGSALQKSKRHHFAIILEFLTDLIMIDTFDVQLLSIVGNFMNRMLSQEDAGTGKEILKFYATLCVKRRPMLLYGENTHCFFDASYHSNVFKKALNIIEKWEDFDAELVCYALIAYPWLCESSHSVQGLEAILNLLQSGMSRRCKGICRLTLLAANAITIVRKPLLASFAFDDVLRLFKEMGGCEHSLRTLAICLPYINDSKQLSSISALAKVCAELLPMLSHWNSSVRQMALQVLCCFHVPLNNTTKAETFEESENMFQILLAAERTPLTISDYRQRLLLLRRLNFSMTKKYAPSSSDQEIITIPLRVILAQFYEHFTIMWPHLYDILDTYAFGLENYVFFSIFFSYLDEATKKITKSKQLDECCLPFSFLDSLIGTNQKAFPDYALFRLQLCLYLKRISELAERRTKNLSPLLIELFRNEYSGSYLGSRLGSIENEQFENIDADSLYLDTGLKNQHENVGDDMNANERYESRRAVKETICALLDLYSSFKSPNAVYMAEEVRKLLNDLLMVPDEKMQKLALKSIFAFKLKFITPYKENLENLVDEKTFLDELARFHIGNEESIVEEKHRADFMEVLIKMVYGKYCMHVKRNETGRRAAIFRFLNGCLPQELDTFLKLLFAPFMSIAGNEGDTLEMMCLRLTAEFDFRNTFSFKTLKGLLNSVCHIASKLSRSLTEEQKRFLFRICLVAALISRLASERIPERSNIRVLKELRTSSSNAFKEFFIAFRERQLAAADLNVLFKFFISPLIISTKQIPLARQSILRLFLSWAEHPRLHYLFRMKFSLGNGEKIGVFRIICNTLISSSIPDSVKENIIDSILLLLSTSDELNECDGVADVVLEEISNILSYIYDSLSLTKVKKKVNLKHLEVLNRLSGYVSDSEISERFAVLLLQYVELGTLRSEDAVRSVLITISRMISSTKDATAFLPRLVTLQSLLTSRQCREGLVSIEIAIASMMNKKKPNDSVLLKAISDLDAWDGRRIDEPDLDCRQAAYNTVNTVLERGDDFSDNLLHLLVHNDYHILTAMNDLSLHVMARTNFLNLINYVGKCINLRSELNVTLNRHMLPLLVKALHENNEMVRHEFVTLLATIVSVFPEHEHLRYFFPLRNTNDTDLDFFENVTHLQIHRRQRAFSRLTQSLECGEVCMPNHVMMRYLIPLLQPYVMEMSSKTSSLSDEALKLLSYIMRSSPWKKYFSMLDFYLKRLKKENVNHKAIIRAIVAIVESFSFNVKDLKEGQDESLGKIEQSVVEETENEMNEDDKENEVDEESRENQDDDQNKNKSEVKNTVYEKVMHYLLPRLLDCAMGKDLFSHLKVTSGKNCKEDDDILRAPVSIAAVKLLQKLPKEVLDQNLHRIILKLCTLLMSHSVSVRETARKTIIEIAKNLGPKYIRFIVLEMKATLSKGYQVHVMIHTVHKLLTTLSDNLKTGDLDMCIGDIIQVCNMDVFGDITEEKSITGITKNVPEAKKNRSFVTYTLLGRYISSQCMAYIFKPLIQAAESNPDAATMQKIGRLLRHFSVGLSSNQGIQPDILLAFIHQTMKEYVDCVNGEIQQRKEDDSVACKKPKVESCLLIEKEPKRIGTISKVSQKSKFHVFVEFGLHILSMILKRRNFDPENDEDIARLDPFVLIVLQCLEMKYERILANALRCTLSLLRFPLPSLRLKIQALADRLFVLLSDYAIISSSGSKGAAFEISQLIYKNFTQLIRDDSDLVLSSKRLQLLLSYIESDVVDSQKQATAFPLIRVIIGRKLKDPKIIEIMEFLCEASVTSEVSHIREQCRQVIALFVGGHPQSKNPAKHVQFYLEQLEYEYESGRKSALEMLGSFFNQFNEEVNDRYCMLAFIKLSMRLVNDESAECRAMVSLAIEQLLRSVSESKYNDVYLATKDWLQSGKEIHQCIAMQVLTVIAKIKNAKFSTTLREILPIITRFFRGNTLHNYAENSVSVMLTCLSVMFEKCDSVPQLASEGLLNPLLKETGTFLQCRESANVQLAASRLCGSLFRNSDPDSMRNRTEPSREKLLEWIIAQLKCKALSDDLAEQIAKNVVFLLGDSYPEDLLKWLCRKLSSVCKFEIVKIPNEAIRRVTVFKISAALILRVETGAEHVIAEHFLPLFYREMQGKSAQNSEELQKIATEVAECFKERLGEEDYTRRITQCRALALARFETRKRKQKEEMVIDPVKFALKKRKRNKAKEAARSRKFKKRKMQK